MPGPLIVAVPVPPIVKSMVKAVIPDLGRAALSGVFREAVQPAQELPPLELLHPGQVGGRTAGRALVALSTTQPSHDGASDYPRVVRDRRVVEGAERSSTIPRYGSDMMNSSPDQCQPRLETQSPDVR